MQLTEMVDDIKVDLGCDINTLGISDDSIEAKINEAIRKVTSYAPYCVIETFNIDDTKKITLPDGTCAVIQILTDTVKTTSEVKQDVYNDNDLFSVSRYMYRQDAMSDPYITLMKSNELKTLQNMVSITDYFFNKGDRTLYINNPIDDKVTVKYLVKYRSLEEIEDQDIIQTIKEYALALCKIIEGNIRRKLQAAPGAISMDGDSLVSEGLSEKNKLDEFIPKQYANIRFGMRV